MGRYLDRGTSLTWIAFALGRLFFRLFFNPHPTVSTAKQKLAQKMGVDAARIQLSHSEYPLSEDATLYRCNEYSVTVPNTIVPVQIELGEGTFTEKRYLNSDRPWSVPEFIERVLRQAPRDAVLLRRDTELRGPFRLASQDVFRLRVNVTFPCKYHFVTANAVDVAVHESQTVGSVKEKVLAQAGIKKDSDKVEFAFCGRTLNHKKQFSSFRIPPGAEIRVILSLLKIQVFTDRSTRSSTTIKYLKSDDVGDLRRRIAKRFHRQPDQIVVENTDGGRLADQSLIVNLDQVYARVVDGQLLLGRRMRVSHRPGRPSAVSGLSFSHSGSGTSDEAPQAASDQAPQITSDQAPQTTSDQAPQTTSDQAPQAVPPPPAAPAAVFVAQIQIGSSVVSRPFPGNAKVRDVIDLVARELFGGVPAARVTLLVGESELSPEADVSNFDDKTDVFATRVAPRDPAAPTQQYRIMLLLGIVPIFATFRFSPEDTLTDIEPFVKIRWSLGELETEFILVSSDDDRRSIPRATRLSEVPPKEQLTVMEVSVFAPVDSPEAESGDLPGESEVDPRVFSTQVFFGSIATRPIPEDQRLRLLFKLSTNEETEIPVVFPKGKTVQHARSKLAEILGRPPDDIILILSGKMLKDQFLLDRLAVGNHAITVYQQESEVVLFGAKA
jgi:hypothetical protein